MPQNGRMVLMEVLIEVTLVMKAQVLNLIISVFSLVIISDKRDSRYTGQGRTM